MKTYPQFYGMLMSHQKDPYKPASIYIYICVYIFIYWNIMECNKIFCSLLNCCFVFVWSSGKPRRISSGGVRAVRILVNWVPDILMSFGWKDWFSKFFVFVEVYYSPSCFLWWYSNKIDIFEVVAKMSNLKFQNPKRYMEVSLNGDTSKTPQNDHFK